MNQLIIAYTTIGSLKDAKDLSKKALEQKLVACTNIIPMHAVYTWKGKAEEAQEFGILLKTTAGKIPALHQFIQNHHPYDCPCFTTWTTEFTHTPYMTWVHGQLKAEVS